MTDQIKIKLKCIVTTTYEQTISISQKQFDDMKYELLHDKSGEAPYKTYLKYIDSTNWSEVDIDIISAKKEKE